MNSGFGVNVKELKKQYCTRETLIGNESRTLHIHARYYNYCVLDIYRLRAINRFNELIANVRTRHRADSEVRTEITINRIHLFRYLPETRVGSQIKTRE